MKIVSGLVTAVMAALFAGCGEQAPVDAAPPPRPSLQLSAGPAVASAANPSPAPLQAAPQPAGAKEDEQVIARVNGIPITMRQFIPPLMEAHGLPLLLNIVQLEVIKQDAAKSHVVVSPDDVRREQEITLSKLFKDADQKDQDALEDAQRKGLSERVQQLREQIAKDREQLLAEYLQNQHYTRYEYDLVIELNAYLRKKAEPMAKGKVTDALVEKQFGIEYGETVQVRYIQLANMDEVGQARRRLKDGEDFAAVAQQMSRNARTAALGGEMGAFSRQTPGLPDAFKDVAFSLQPGQVSDTVNVGGNFYIIRLEKKFAPKAVKFDAVRESLRQSITDRLTDAIMEQLHVFVGNETVKALKIENPVLARQFAALNAKRDAAIQDRGKIDEQWKKERPGPSPSTAPAQTQSGAAPPATVPAAQP